MRVLPSLPLVRSQRQFVAPPQSSLNLAFLYIKWNRQEVLMNVINLKEKEVFKKGDRGFTNLVDEKYLQINQVCLEAGQQVPRHNGNSNVTLTVVHGEGTFYVGNEVTRMGPGKLLRIPFQSPMSIKNESKDRLAFLVIKAPHPNEM